MNSLPYNGFLNRRSAVRIRPGTPDFSSKINALAFGAYAHEARTAPGATVIDGAKDGTVDSPSVLFDLLTPGSQSRDWVGGRAWR